jgi:hypothetical protein
LVFWLGGYLLGEQWGMVWVIGNFPLSMAMKNNLWRFGVPVYVTVVSLLNAGLFYLIVLSIVSMVHRQKHSARQTHPHRPH